MLPLEPPTVLKPAPATRPTCRPVEGSRIPWQGIQAQCFFCCYPIVGVPYRSRSCGARAGLSRIGDCEPTEKPRACFSKDGTQVGFTLFAVLEFAPCRPSVWAKTPDPLLTSGPHAVLARTGK